MLRSDPGATMTDLKLAFGDRYRVVDDGTDDSERAARVWCYEIRGRYGAIFPHGFNGTLAVRVDSVRVARRFEPLGLKAVQKGDSETVFVFDLKLTDRVATLILAKRRRLLSPEQLAVLAERLRHGRERTRQVDSKLVTVPEGGTSQAQERVLP